MRRLSFFKNSTCLNLKVLSLPFLLTNENVGNIGDSTELWIGQFDASFASPWTDLFIAMVKHHFDSFNVVPVDKKVIFNSLRIVQIHLVTLTAIKHLIYP